MSTNGIRKLLVELQHVQDRFATEFGVTDIFSNSKIFEILIADHLGLTLIPGHSGSRDAKDSAGNEIEIKHFKETSSNHSWTFNDFSDNTIEKLRTRVASVVFAHVDDLAEIPVVDWYFQVPGKEVSQYLKSATKAIANMRKMINISARQIETKMHHAQLSKRSRVNPYSRLLSEVFRIIRELEAISGVSNLLTSSKLWELVVAIELDHKVNSEQGGRAGAYDAEDRSGGSYEYKVIKLGQSAWNFQDISDAVLKKYRDREGIVLAVVDKSRLKTKTIYFVDPDRLVPHLKNKLEARRQRLQANGEELRRNQVSLSASELRLLGAKSVFSA